MTNTKSPAKKRTIGRNAVASYTIPTSTTMQSPKKRTTTETETEQSMSITPQQVQASQQTTIDNVVGASVLKFFPELGWFRGKVVKHDPVFYNVVYEDDDYEDMDEDDLANYMVSTTMMTTTSTTATISKRFNDTTDSICLWMNHNLAPPNDDRYHILNWTYNTTTSEKNGKRSNKYDFHHDDVSGNRINEETGKKVCEFFLFMSERQRVLERCTNGTSLRSMNPIFQDYTFCNVYRELDRGTRYFHKHIVQLWPQHQKQTSTMSNKRTDWVMKVLFASYTYRLVNRIQSFIEYGKIPQIQDTHHFIKYMNEQYKNNVIFFTGAHQTTNFASYQKGLLKLVRKDSHLLKAISKQLLQVMSKTVRKPTKNKNQSNAMDTDDDDDDDSTSTASSNRITNQDKQYVQILCQLPNVGNFFAWQILCDMKESKCFVDNDNDDSYFCELGPGAIDGLRIIFDKAGGNSTSTTPLDRIKQLVQHQTLVFDTLGIEFHYWKTNEKLGAKEMEHSLCEYSKFYRIQQSLRINQNAMQKKRLYKSNSCLDTNLVCVGCPIRIHKRTGVHCSTCHDFCCKNCYDCGSPSSVSASHSFGWCCQSCQEFERNGGRF